jgi:hypothetical protein
MRVDLLATFTEPRLNTVVSMTSLVSPDVVLTFPLAETDRKAW